MKNLKIKSTDRIKKVNGKSVSSSKDFLRKMSQLKKKKKIVISLERGKKKYKLLYKNLGNYKYKLVKTLTLKNKKKSTKSSSKKKKKATAKPPSKKKSILNKYKKHLQKGYIFELQSFVYRNFDFDSEKLFSLRVGQQVLISKKIFKPNHGFGSFYKVFIKKPQKVVGYLSEVEVIPQYVKNQKEEYVSNSKYQIIDKKRGKNNDIVDMSRLSLEEQKFLSNKQSQGVVSPSFSLFSNFKTFFGLSAGVKVNPLNAPPNVNISDLLIGVRLSGTGLKDSKVEIDANLSFTPSSNSFFHGNLQLGYPVFTSSLFSVQMLSGVQGNWDRVKEPLNRVTIGYVGSLSLLVPLKRQLFWRVDFRGGYDFVLRSVTPSLVTSLQISF